MYIDILGTREFGHKGIWTQGNLETMIFGDNDILFLEHIYFGTIFITYLDA